VAMCALRLTLIPAGEDNVYNPFLNMLYSALVEGESELPLVAAEPELPSGATPPPAQKCLLPIVIPFEEAGFLFSLKGFDSGYDAPSVAFLDSIHTWGGAQRSIAAVRYGNEWVLYKHLDKWYCAKDVLSSGTLYKTELLANVDSAGSRLLVAAVDESWALPTSIQGDRSAVLLRTLAYGFVDTDRAKNYVARTVHKAMVKRKLALGLPCVLLRGILVSVYVGVPVCLY
jgi:hypothetical protein